MADKAGRGTRVRGKGLIIIILVLAASCIFPAAVAEENKISVVTTVFPIYDWTREVIGENDQAQLTLLLDNGVDMHSYQPAAADILKIVTCDIFICVGGESDNWVEDALREAADPGMIVIRLTEALGEDVRAEEIVEGMQHEQEDPAGDDESPEADEHVWLSLRNARKLVNVISSALGEADPAHAESYQANAAAYAEKLAELDREYSRAVSEAVFRTVLFGDRFPFRYLFDDYGLRYYAAFPGCSAETEASFQTIIFLAQKVDELKLPAVLTIEGGNHKIAETVISTTAEKNQKLLTMNSMQACTLGDAQAGVTYLSIMRDNLEVLKQALY